MVARRDVIAGLAATGGMIASAHAGTRGHALPAGEPAAEAGPATREKRREGVALALGGGAAKAFAHIPVLEAFDDLGIRPAEMAGTSMGAILGSLYASGMSGREIRAYVVDLFIKRRPLLKKLFLDSGRPLSSLLNLTRPAIIDPIVLFEAVLPPDLPRRFADLQVPMKIVATDFHAQDAVVLEEGDLLPAIAASSALPVLLTPVRIGSRVLIDGGFTNPTPFDVLDASRFVSVGVDVTGIEVNDDGKLPGALETWIGSFSIVLHSLVTEKLKRKQPDLLIEPPVGTFKTMDFFRLEKLLAEVDRSKDRIKRDLEAVLERA